MNVLHLANTPLSGAPYRLMQVQRIGGINARLISHRSTFDRYSSMVFPSDILLQDDRSNREKREQGVCYSRGEIYELFEDADILHCHNYLTDLYLFRLFPHLKKYLKTKIVIFQVHSPRVSLKHVEKDLKHKDVAKRLVVAQYQVRQYPEATPVPNAIPVDDESFTPLHRINCPPIITYSPSNTSLRDWNNKGYPETISALKRLTHPYGIDIITNTPNVECLERKRRADIAIDEIVTGSYHLNTLEALSMGLVAICGMDDLCKAALCGYTGTDHHPIVIANPQNLSLVLDGYLNDKDMLIEKQRESRDFMKLHWSEKRLNEFFTRIYMGKDNA